MLWGLLKWDRTPEEETPNDEAPRCLPESQKGTRRLVGVIETIQATGAMPGTTLLILNIIFSDRRVVFLRQRARQSFDFRLSQEMGNRQTLIVYDQESRIIESVSRLQTSQQVPAGEYSHRNQPLA